MASDRYKEYMSTLLAKEVREPSKEDIAQVNEDLRRNVLIRLIAGQDVSTEESTDD